MNQLSHGTQGVKPLDLDCQDKVVTTAVDIHSEQAKAQPEESTLLQKLDSLDESQIHEQEFVHGI
jgi:hypothetical protein